MLRSGYEKTYFWNIPVAKDSNGQCERKPHKIRKVSNHLLQDCEYKPELCYPPASRKHPRYVITNTLSIHMSLLL